MLRCSGDEDISTQGSRRAAMSRALAATTDVLVDLSDLNFADSSLMIDLAMLSRRLRITGRRMRVCNAQPQVWRLIEIVGLHRLPGVVGDPRAPAVA